MIYVCVQVLVNITKINLDCSMINNKLLSLNPHDCRCSTVVVFESIIMYNSTTIY